MAEERGEEIRSERLRKRAELFEAGTNPYPAETKRTHTVAEALDQFDQLSDEQTPITLDGRVMAVRKHGGVAFVDLRDASGTLQLQFGKDSLPEDYFTALDQLDTGDFIEAAGKLTHTTRGQQTLAVMAWHFLTKSIAPLPSTWYGLKDHEARFRNREVDLLINDEARAILQKRSEIVSWIRSYMTNQGYMEVETPVLQSIHGGAAAKPFSTQHNALGIPLHLRIAAELHLKRLLVAGFEKVFEIERRFRNEGIDRQHNPEFTMLEAQWAYADYEDLMDETERLIDALCTDLFGTTDIEWQGTVLSWKAPLPRLRYVDLVSEALGVDILSETDPEVYLGLFAKHKLKTPDATNYYQLVDELYKQLVRPKLIQPTILYDYPAAMAPLAKRSLTDPRIAEKFQLLAAGLELGNNYTELNDPVVQREILEEQQEHRTRGDEEAHELDEPYLQAMEHGMPPNVGWGIGIDRLVMLLTNAASIRDVIAFPLLRPEQSDTKSDA